jgi:uncharacterized cupin superfamily protein
MIGPIINIDMLEFKPRPPSFAAPDGAKRKFDASKAEVSLLIGAQKLGYNITEVPPGTTGFPFHNHHVNEELFFILEGTGQARFGESTLPLRKGDFFACPPGDQSVAHQIINTGNAPLRYLSVSTMLFPDICEYPDSQKFLVAEKARNADGSIAGFRHVGRLCDTADYWEGE